MKKILIAGIICMLAMPFASAAEITADELMEKIDDNLAYDTIKYSAKMTITVRGKVREKAFMGYGQGTENSYMEFTAPARDRGMRFLIVGKNLWIYDPTEDQAIKLSESMMKGGSFMGSDFSYKDTAENPETKLDYDSKIVGSEKIDGRDCYILELNAKRKKVTYPKKKVWIDKAHYMTLKQELYAKSGKLLKVMKMDKVKKLGDRYYPMRIELSNMLKKNSKTVMEFVSIEFDVKIPENIFSIKRLKM